MNHQLFRLLRPFVHRFTDSRRIRKMDVEVLKRFPGFDAKKLQGKIVVDLGANRGDFTVWAANHGALVIAMEPDKTAFHYLAKRTASYANVFLLNAGAVAETSILKLYFHANRSKDPLGHTISSSIDANKKNVSVTNFEEILGINLGGMLGNLEIFLMKIDIEGAEVLLWDGIKSRHDNIQYLLMETHENQTSGDYSDFSSFIAANHLQEKWKLDWL